MEYNLIVNKAGSNLHNTASVKIEVMSEAALHAYNTLNGSNYKAYPTPCYALENGNIEFSSNDLYKTQAVTINPSELENYINTDATYVIPFELTQGTDSINSEKNTFSSKLFQNTLSLVLNKVDITVTGLEMMVLLLLPYPTTC